MAVAAKVGPTGLTVALVNVTRVSGLDLVRDSKRCCGAGEEELDLVVAPGEGSAGELATGEEVGGDEGKATVTDGGEGGDGWEVEA
jgi:hypothetical protein